MTSKEKLEYSVNPPLEPPTPTPTDLRRKVSRVESLRRLLLGRPQHENKRLFEKRRYRFGRSSVSKADKAIGTDLDFMGGSEDDLFDRSSSRFNESCDSFDLDSVSQLSLAETSDGKSSLSASKSISIDNIPQEVTSYHRSSYTQAFSRSKLAALPEEQGTLTRSCREKRRLSTDPAVLLGGPQSLTAELSPASSGTLRRRRSQSLADIQAPLPFRQENQAPLQFATQKSSLHVKQFSKTKSEESGYDSDTTRKSGSSPRGSVKSDSFDPSETDSSTCDSHLKPSNISTRPPAPQTKPKIKKPPRKSKEEARKAEISCQTEIQPQFKPKLDYPKLSPINNNNNKPLPGSEFADNMPSVLPSLTSKSFKMLRVSKRKEDELGIIISKKRDPGNGTTGYIIAHVEPAGLVNK